MGRPRAALIIICASEASSSLRTFALKRSKQLFDIEIDGAPPSRTPESRLAVGGLEKWIFPESIIATHFCYA